jgi:hypothetical protein|tara:strand:+ start:1181 stop:1369 length:189 start_codon:yes stop_codon:yes gene_type:complete
MKIILIKNWRYAGQVNMAGKTLEIKDEVILKYLKENGYLEEKKKTKKKKSDEKITEINDLIN